MAQQGVPFRLHHTYAVGYPDGLYGSQSYHQRSLGSRSRFIAANVPAVVLLDTRISANMTHKDGDLCSDTWTEADREEVQKLLGPIWVVGASGFVGAKLFFSLARIRSDVFRGLRSR
jgi:hypothetical protein